jgi:uncharacterized protein (TIGR02266 family)
MRELFVDYATGSELLTDYLSDPEPGGLFVRTTESYRVGEPVVLVVKLPQIADGVALRGTVIWRRAPVRWRSALSPGIGIEFHPGHRNRVQFLLDFCNGELSSMRKTGRRLPVEFRVDIVSDGKRISGLAKDISRGGMFVQTDARIGRDSKVNLELHLGGGKSPEVVPGRVAWEKAAGKDSGIGFEFKFRTPAKRMQISHYVRQIEGRLSVPPPQKARPSAV